jgi:hypothetical protein
MTNPTPGLLAEAEAALGDAHRDADAAVREIAALVAAAAPVALPASTDMWAELDRLNYAFMAIA